MYTIVRTEHNDHYIINEKGEITQLKNDIPYSQHKFSGSWLALGIRQVLPFNRLGGLISIEKACEIQEFKFKNGRGKYYMVDLDHGTQRIWGSRITGMWRATR